MPSLRDFRSSAPFLNEDGKNRLIDNEEPFFVDRVEFQREGKFGPRWVLHCTDANNTTFLLSFAESESRNSEYGAMMDLVTPDDPLGPVILTRITTNAGRPFLTLRDAIDERGA